MTEAICGLEPPKRFESSEPPKRIEGRERKAFQPNDAPKHITRLERGGVGPSRTTAARPLRRRSEDATDRRVQSTYSLFSKTSTRTSHRYRLLKRSDPLHR